ncbi:M48 family metalloprotease [Burkholderia ubonensis]|uniref:M48 family metalloprotease n=1 Tax=Burkholderia ubonensis TaxID=101571 RepID=UPI000AC23BC3|nr:M48 family metalloprotease [Burkholderia ubonensis]
MSTPIDEKLRLNPFSFPSDTTLRFLILVGFVVTASGNLYADFWSSVYAKDAANSADCNSTALSEIFRIMQSESTSFSFYQRAAPLIGHCAQLLRPRGVWEIGGIFLTLAMTVMVYLFTPTWKLKAGRLQNVTASEPPGLYQELHDLCAKAALPTTPAFVWSPLSDRMPAVFGRRNQYYVELSSGFLANYLYSDVSAFRVIILHELAHFRNGDINKTYLTVSAWIAFLVTNVAPAVIILFLTRVHDPNLILDVIFSVLLIALSGLAVLRAREYYADIRASIWDGTLVNIQRALPRMDKGGSIWRRYFWSHPESNERRKVIEDTSRLFPLSMGVAFGLGLVAWMSESALITISFPFLPVDPDPMEFAIFLTSLIILTQAILLLFVVGAIGIGIWRASFAALVTYKQTSSGAGRVGVAVGVSYLVYLLFASIELFLSRGKSGHSLLVNFFVLQLIISIALTVGCFIIFRWVANAASGWLEVTLASRSPSPILGLTVGVTLLLVIGTLFGTMFITAGQLLTTLPEGRSSAEWFVFLGGTTVFIGLVVAWAFPLAGWICRKRNTPTTFPDWVFLDNCRPELQTQEPLRLRSAVMIGVGTGMIGCLPWALLYFIHYLPGGGATWVASSARWLHALALGMGGGFDALIPTATFQAVAAAIAAARAERLNALCGLFAASIAGCIMSIGIYVMLDIGGGLLSSIAAFTSLGNLIALPAAIIAGWLRHTLHGSRIPIRGRV